MPIGVSALRRQEYRMFTHRFASTHHRFTPRGLAMALAVSLALGVVPMATAARHASTAVVHSQSSGMDAVAAGSDGAAQHSIIFVGGRTPGDAHHARVHPPVPCAPQTGSRSACNDSSLNPQPIPPGHRNHRATDESLTHAPTKPRMHRPVANPHKGD